MKVWVAEVARLRNSPRKLNSGEFSYQFFHSLGVTGLLFFRHQHGFQLRQASLAVVDGLVILSVLDDEQP